ncbi:MAG TPA: hypothetical protein VFR85_13500 [Anaeromyxobacteraceae bacterium]|nr:hypothetical protein [Anaeromyxobacteraceae bacterium]
MAAPGIETREGRGLGAAAGWAVAVWAACGLTMALGRAAFGLEVALAVHLAAAPVFSFLATVLCWNHRRHPGPLGTAALMAGVPAGLDALVVAPFLERSYAMFASPVGTWIPLALIFLASLATARLLSRPPERRVFLGWMATPEEQREPLPGDRWLAGKSGSTHAIGIAAGPAAVWPWLAQMGLGRAGWYSHDRLDNPGRHSAEAILPDLQSVTVGDRWPSTPDGRTFFEVLEVDPGRHLVLGFHMGTAPMRSLPFGDPSPPVHQRATWSFALRPAGEGSSRLLVRGRGVSRPAWRWLPVSAFFWLAHVVMQRKQLLGIRRRAERARA